MSEKDKTILIVIIAIIALFGCMVISCCAASLFVFSKADINTVKDILDNGSADLPLDILDSSDSENPEKEVDFYGDEADGLSDAELMIIAATEKTRQMTAEEKLAPVYQTEEELREYLVKQWEEISDEELEEDKGLFNILGFIPEDFDLRQFYIDLYTEQIAGFYDPEENQMYLIENASSYENALTLAHEYTHYLQYNDPEISKKLIFDDDECEDNNETCVIINALIEGDASLTESLTDIDTILSKNNISQSDDETSAGSVYDTAPKFFQDSLVFPYVYGFDFVAYYYLKGGFDAVNDLYTDLPQSIEQIMHPEKYLQDLPVNVTLEPFRSIIDEQSDIIREDVLNESDISMILGSGFESEWQLGERQVKTASEGWGGGAYIFAESEDKPLFFSKIIWDSVTDAEEAESGFSLYCDKRFGSQTAENVWAGENDSAVYLIRQDDVLYWMILPDNFAADNFVSLINNGSSL